MHIKVCLAGVLATVLSASSSLSGAAFQFSAYEFSRNPARVDNSLRVQMTGRTVLSNYRFVARVGGVNFDNKIDLSSATVHLDYSRSAEDGKRARITVNGQSATLPLYDWELKPIVEYADSQYTAVVSIFGEGPDPINFRYIDYHPAFEDTHMGMRLLQADILLLDPITFSEVPTENGEKIYQAGEAPEKPLNIRLNNALILSAIMDSEQYQSWVLTDMDSDGRLDLEGGVAKISVEPYYHVWKSGDTEERDRLVDSHDQLVSSTRPQLQEYENALAARIEATPGSLDELLARSEVERLESVLGPAVERLELLRTQIENHEPEVIEVEGLTAKLKNAEPVFYEVAPFVYDAVRKTASYAALFRGVKEGHPQQWNNFRQKVIQSVSLAPAETPNQFER